MWNKINLSFADPLYLLLLFLIPALIMWYVWRRKKLSANLVFPGVFSQGNLPKTFRQKTYFIPFVLRLAALALLIIALARPQGNIGFIKEKTEGIDIIVCMDVSYSMLTKDLDPDRITSAKKIVKNFIEKRPDDRIGFVIFEGQGFTQCPLTLDHNSLIQLVDFVKPGLIGGQTAIGMGLATAVNRLRKSTAKSKVVILLTDGENLEGAIEPSTAADLAQEYGIRVYTIGVGTRGNALSPMQGPGGGIVFDYQMVEIDEELLKSISAKTNGQYFRAVNEAKLEQIFTEIDRLEKSKIENKTFTHKEEQFLWFVLAAGGCLLLEFLLRAWIYRINP